MISIKEYDEVVERARTQRPDGWRFGQTVFNFLMDTYPDVANGIRATKLDMFYNDDNVNEFRDYLLKGDAPTALGWDYVDVNPLLLSDAYKQSHRVQYPEGTEVVYSNWTARSDKYAKTQGGVIVFGIQAFVTNLHNYFKANFFDVPEEMAIKQFEVQYTEFFGSKPDVEPMRKLHQHGQLPIEIKALPEGSLCPVGVPMLTIKNTQPEFFWVTNFLETIMSSELWMPMTSATIAGAYRSILENWADKTCDNHAHIDFQAHDFSMRGMPGLHAAMLSGAGHLLFFKGTDTIPAVSWMKHHYTLGEYDDIVGTSIPATEHSVMSMGTREDELGTFRRMITETYPDGFVSIVSDTWDLWQVLTDYMPKLKNEILARDGKVVIRPDSGDPVDIIAGYKVVTSLEDYRVTRGDNTVLKSKDEFYRIGSGFIDIDIQKIPSHEAKGVVELLWDVFGGTINEKGYKVLDPHVGAIYGDSITLERADEICRRLEAKGFASSNIVFGVGSYTYQYNTRDTYGFAMKATAGKVNGELREIYKDPITDDGTKKSLKGLLYVTKNEVGKYVVMDQATEEEEKTGALNTIYKDGTVIVFETLGLLRERARGSMRHDKLTIKKEEEDVKITEWIRKPKS